MVCVTVLVFGHGHSVVNSPWQLETQENNRQDSSQV